MSDESSPSFQPLIAPIGIDLDLHPELLEKKGVEKEIMIPFEILNLNSPIGEPLESSEHGKIIRKRERSLKDWGTPGRRRPFKPEKELKEVP